MYRSKKEIVRNWCVLIAVCVAIGVGSVAVLVGMSEALRPINQPYYNAIMGK